MRPYRSLRLIGTLLKAIAWIELIAGLGFAFVLISQISAKDYGEYQTLMTQDYTNVFLMLIACLIAFLLLLGISEFISLTVTVAGHVSSIAHNVYELAQKIEFPKKELSDNEL